MNNNGLAIVEKHNALLTQIRKGTTVEDMRQLFADVKEFIAIYEAIDTDAIKRVAKGYSDKLQEMLKENDIVYTRLSEKAEKVSSMEYDFGKETDDTRAVQNKVLQLMAQLPKAKTLATTGAIANTIEQAIKSGTVGCKAVLELMKYPVYLDMISENQKYSAFAGSKSESQQAFERLKEKELREVEKSRADIYLKGFHLRNIDKQVRNFSKTSVWA